MQLNNKKKNKQPNQKVGRRPKKIFLQRRHTDDQQTHEKMLNTHYQRNANQNLNEVSPHTRQNGPHQKTLQTIHATEDEEKRERPCTVGGNVH